MSLRYANGKGFGSNAAAIPGVLALTRAAAL